MAASTSSSPSSSHAAPSDPHEAETRLLSSGLTAEESRRVANTLRFLSIDAVQKANSGHPGAPMGLADVATAIWQKLRFDPSDLEWTARDRFILSCGHASALQYSLLHLWGMGIKRKDLESFRQLGSQTPGHPEVGHTPGVEMTTGPLGQGCATSVGLALGAERLSRQILASGGGADHPWRGQKTVALCSDGDLMEGISYEAASLAGHLELGDLIWFYDDNRISIDGETSLSFSEDVASRFLAMGWRVSKVDGHDPVRLCDAVDQAWESDGRPTIVICRTHIGYGSPNKVDRSASHGAPLGVDEIALTREALGWTLKPFSVPQAVRSLMKREQQRKIYAAQAWRERFEAWSERAPQSASLASSLFAQSGLSAGELEELLKDQVPSSGATRKLSNQALTSIFDHSPALMGGSADLSGSNGLSFDEPSFGSPHKNRALSPYGRVLHFGVREHAMAAITNGITLFGSARGFCGTFLVFSDYLRPAVRLAALSQIPSVFVLTHDSVFLGEDGPTHQPVEHAWALRLIPGVVDFRPASGPEVAAAWAWALSQDTQPVAMMLTRQALPELPLQREVSFADIQRGAYLVCQYRAESFDDEDDLEERFDESFDDEIEGLSDELEATLSEVLEAAEAAEATEDDDSMYLEDFDDGLLPLDRLLGAESDQYDDALRAQVIELVSDVESTDLDPVTLIGTGSEVSLCVEVAQTLAAEGIWTRVVSMPSVKRFLEQPEVWRELLLGFGPRVVIEAGSTLPWSSVAGSDALCIGVDTFGASAPMRDIARHFSLTPDDVTERVTSWLREL